MGPDARRARALQPDTSVPEVDLFKSFTDKEREI